MKVPVTTSATGPATLNMPVVALMFLEPNNQTRFKFTMAKTGASVYVPWEIEYREVQPETLIRTTASRDLPARGRFRIEPLLRSRLDERAGGGRCGRARRHHGHLSMGRRA